MLTKKGGTAADPDVEFTDIDYEEQSAGYQAAYSRLAAAETAPVDPAAHVGDVLAFVGQEFAALAQRDARVKAWVAGTDARVSAPFVQALAAAGYQI